MAHLARFGRRGRSKAERRGRGERAEDAASDLFPRAASRSLPGLVRRDKRRRDQDAFARASIVCFGAAQMRRTIGSNASSGMVSKFGSKLFWS